MRISYWSSDGCSSDLRPALMRAAILVGIELAAEAEHPDLDIAVGDHLAAAVLEIVLGADIYIRHFRLPLSLRPPSPCRHPGRTGDRKSVVQGQRVSVRCDLGGRSIIQTHKYPM